MTGTSFSGGGFAGYAAAGTGFHNAYNNNNDQSINNHHVHHNNTYTTNSNVGNINNGNPVFTGTQATHPFIATAQDIANNVMARASNTHVNSGTFRGALFAIAQRLARCWTVTALALPTGPAVAALTVQVRGVRDGSTVREGPDVGENADAANAGDEASFATETGMALAAMRAGSAARTGGVGNIGAENNNDGGTILQQAVQIGGSPTQQVVQIVDWIRRLISRQADMLILPDLVDLQTLAEMVERAAGTAGGAQVVGELRERYLELAAWCIILAIWRTG
ncbi:uncharacterized protein K452DRAFT_286006 [Aplosporella prunicola CBS 121167]|uniref:Uncharacterized protein n=1 Tax=Aplosporella prunicola CBS 121167 TaxID=1176127 RepID=A0A6A6BG66_9PEZI|nr:uncharacterized protein K452DRAFT_286006 [Aplosporella prunicola CBS 121167]KAF2143160.1 hypothetical protein K452DRAFT_286006 [Aplosporella prunicola CBS 121167]